MSAEGSPISGTVHRLAGRATGWWGMVWALLVLGMMLATVLFAHVYLAGRWESLPPPGLALPAFPWLATLLAVGGVVPAALAHRAVASGGQRLVQPAAGAALLAGVAFLGVLAGHVQALPFAPQDHAFASTFTVALVFHGVCAAVAVAQWAFLQLHVWGDPLPGRAQVIAVNAALCSYFVASAWLAVAATLYLLPRLW